MKLLHLLLIFVCMAATVRAKMSSVVEVSSIHNIKIEDDKITIVGDGVFYSRMVTTEKGKDSNFVIGGQPSVNYTAKAFATQFVVTPYILNEHGEMAKEEMQKWEEEMSKEEKRKWEEVKIMFKKIWADNLAVAKLLKEKGRVKIIFEGVEVRFIRGNLSLVKGGGMIQQAKSEQVVAPDR